MTSENGRRAASARGKIQFLVGGCLSFGGALLAAAWMGSASAQPPAEKEIPAAVRHSRQVAAVTAIDRAGRRVTIQNADGERRTLSVPPEVKAFDTLKVGDNIEIDYSESVGVTTMPAGTKPSVTERSSGVRAPSPGAVSADRELIMTAEVVSVNPTASTITFRGPRGQVQTMNVADPTMQKRLDAIKPGEVIRVSYREAIAAMIQPARQGGQKAPQPAAPQSAPQSAPPQSTPQPAPPQPGPPRPDPGRR